MTIEATAEDIGLLLRLAELDLQSHQLPPDTYRSRREATREGIPRPLLERYETLLEIARLPAVVAMERGSCSGCHVRLPTMIEYRAKRKPAIHNCPHCHRMLYVPELLQEVPRPPVAGRHARTKRTTRGEPMKGA